MIRTQVILTMLTTLSLMSFDLIGVNAQSNCRVFGNSSEKYEDLIPVGNKLEQSSTRFYLGSGGSRSLACNIVKNSGELSLVYALPNNSPLNRVRIKVYVDGNLRNTFDLSRGEVLRRRINLRGVSGYKLDFETASPQNNFFSQGYVYTLDK